MSLHIKREEFPGIRDGTSNLRRLVASSRPVETSHLKVPDIQSVGGLDVWISKSVKGGRQYIASVKLTKYGRCNQLPLQGLPECKFHSCIYIWQCSSCCYFSSLIIRAYIDNMIIRIKQ